MAPGEQRSALRVFVADDRGRRLRAIGVSRWLTAVAPPRARGTVSVALVSDRTSRTLNRRYRRIDRPTDVLSFPANPGSPAQRTRRKRSKDPVKDLFSVSSVSSVVESFLGEIVI